MTSVVKTFTVALCVLLIVALLYLSFLFYLQAQALLGLLVLLLAVGIAVVFGMRRFYASRFIFPGLAAVLLFIAFPVLYTIYLGFTNYSSFNLLSFERATEVLLQRVIIDSNSEREFQVVQDNDQYRIFFPAADNAFITAPIRLDGAAMQVSSAPIDSAHDYPVLARRDALKLRKAIAEVSVITPLGVRLQNAGLRRFAEVQAEYQRGAAGELIATVDGTRLQADHTTGFYTASSGARVSPGWRVWVGADNFSRIANSAGIRGPIIRIFVWTFTFAILSVGLTFALGVLLATVLQWPQLAGRGVYRVLLILPYAVPAFISILIFRGLFNQNFGEINLLLEALFNIRPEWFTDGLMARVMIVIVNVWLGYPYMMLLAMGFLQSVPADHKRAASLEGASTIRVFFQITLPQILPPFLPLLIASFAFNFNNIVLILLLTNGQPDILGTLIPAGQTDILGSFTYRIAFKDSGQQFGLAGAITFLIFIVVGALAYTNFLALRRSAAARFHGSQ